MKWGVFLYPKIEMYWRDEACQFIVEGDYELIKLSEQEAHGVVDEFEFTITGEALQIEALLQQQMLGTVATLAALQVRRR